MREDESRLENLDLNLSVLLLESDKEEERRKKGRAAPFLVDILDYIDLFWRDVAYSLDQAQSNYLFEELAKSSYVEKLVCSLEWQQ